MSRGLPTPPRADPALTKLNTHFFFFMKGSLKIREE